MRVPLSRGMEAASTDNSAGPLIDQIPAASAATVSSSVELTPKWRERVAALKNMPPVFRMVWEAAPSVIVASLICRVLVALIPLAALYVTKVIVNDIVDYRQHQTALPHNFWYLVGLEFALAGLLAGVLIRMEFMRNIAVECVQTSNNTASVSTIDLCSRDAAMLPRP